LDLRKEYPMMNEVQLQEILKIIEKSGADYFNLMKSVDGYNINISITKKD
jgi:hypothetical protein